MARVKEIWDLDCRKARLSSQELQSIDPTKPFRLHLVVGRDRIRGDACLTVLPIQTPDPKATFQFRLDAERQNKLLNDSWVVCSQILTLKGDLFISPRHGIGTVDDASFQDTMFAVKQYLKLP